MIVLVSRSTSALVARAVLSLCALALPLASSGCTDVACFEWTEAEGTCPMQGEAGVFFQDQFCGGSDIDTVDSDGEFDDGACCYAVTKRDVDEFDPIFCEGPSVGVSVGVGPSAVSASSGGVGGFGGGGVGGSAGGAGGAGGEGGSGGAGGSSSCIGCNEAISGGDPALLCSESIALYESYMMCLCSGACSMQCDDLCSGGAKSMECSDCESDAVNGCGNELSACAGDI